METEDAVQAILDRLADLVEHAESLTYIPPSASKSGAPGEGVMSSVGKLSNLRANTRR